MKHTGGEKRHWTNILLGRVPYWASLQTRLFSFLWIPTEETKTGTEKEEEDKRKLEPAGRVKIPEEAPWRFQRPAVAAEHGMVGKI